MTNLLLTINAGSSSIKFAAFQMESGDLNRLADGHIEGIGATATFSARQADGEKTEFVIDESLGSVGHQAALGAILDWLEDKFAGSRVLAVGHRVVHGGPNFAEPLLIDAASLDVLRRLEPLAPLHQPHNIAGVEAAMHAFPDAIQVACFDTAFHRSHPYTSDTFGLPRSYYDEGIRRYGFHGLSYEFIAGRLQTLEPVIASGRVVVAHLGNGASLCGLSNGRSMDSTMGFTALDGMPMGTRCGQLDPGVVLYLMSEKKMTAAEISDLLYKQSGLKGMSGVSNDMRALEASDDPSAKEAIEYFVSRIRREVGALAASIGGLDAIVFTGGIGEHAWRIREAVLGDLGWIGVHLDVEANRAGQRVISMDSSPVKALVIQTDEERMIAEHTADVAGFIKTAAVDARQSAPAA